MIPNFANCKKVATICLVVFLTKPYKTFCQNKCEDLKNGTFYSYTREGIESIFIRHGEMQKELNTQSEDSTVWQIKWVGNCSYTLKFLQGNGYPDGQIIFLKQHIFFFRVLEITDNYYLYESHQDGPSGKLIFMDTVWLKQKPSLKKNNWPLIVYTDKGDRVNLYENGKWEYAKQDSLAPLIPKITETSIALNENKFVKDKSATFLVKSKKLKVGIYINPDKWGVTNGGINPAEFNFSQKELDILASLITERASINLSEMAELILENAKNQSDDVEIIKKEYRIVNGIKMLCLQMKMTIKGMKFIYFSYNFSNKNGAVQLTSVTNAYLFDKNYKLIENFLDGLVILK
jgi:hypothetical protein